MDEIVCILISDSGSCNEQKKAQTVISQIESPIVQFIYESRDFIAGGSRLESKRKAVDLSDIIVIILSDEYIERPECMYDVAMAACLERHTIVIDKRKSNKKMPPLLSGYPKISNRTNTKHMIEKLRCKIENYRKDSRAQEQKQLRKVKDLAHAFIRDVEREADLIQQKALQREIHSLQKINQQYYKEKKVMRQIEITEAEISSLDFERELRRRFDAEKTIREMKKDLKEMRIREQTLLAHIKFLSEDRHVTTVVEHKETTFEENIHLNFLEEQINKVLIEISKVNNCKATEIGKEPSRRIPSDLRCFCQKYEKMIGPQIRRFGNLLDLSDEQIDKVQEYKQYGDTEMFWQTIRLWEPNLNGHGAFVTLLNALEGIGVDIGGKPMRVEEVRVLHEKLPFLLKNCYKVESLVPILLSKHVLSDITMVYVLQAKNDQEMMLRMINVLTTKENGLHVFCEALCDTSQEFIKEEILNAMQPTNGRSNFPEENTDENTDSTCSPYSSDDGKSKVAVVAPVYNVKPNIRVVTRDPCENTEKDNVCKTRQPFKTNMHNPNGDKQREIIRGCSIQ